MRSGADPDQLDLLARTLDEGADRTERSIADLASFSRRITWSGPDRDRHLQSFEVVARGPAASAVADLRSMSADLRRQADQQRSASDSSSLGPADTGPTPAAGAASVGPALATVVGDLATATSVVVIVPGIGSNAANFGGLVADARTLRSATGGDAASVAVIAWLGYDAPAGFDEPVRLGEALSAERADDGAESLRGYLGTLALRRDAEVTLIGHSYGSLVVAGAARDNASVDRVIVLGSPGLGVDHLADLRLAPATRFFAMSTLGDAVSHTQWFGLDPTLPAFGGRTLDGDGWQGAPAIGLAEAHSSYYDPGSQTVDNLALAVTGQRVRLEPRSRIPWADSPMRATDLPLARPVWSVIDLVADELRR